MAASNAPEQNSVTTRDTLISTISTRAVLLGAYGAEREREDLGFLNQRSRINNHPSSINGGGI
jgi:hypothetical protein